MIVAVSGIGYWNEITLLRLELSVHNAATWYMAGIIWLIQLVHYPMFRFMDRATFQSSHAFHSTAIGFVVIPAMLLELGLATTIIYQRGAGDWPALAGFLLVLILWGLTFFVMVPLHGRLASGGFQPDVINALVQWNWLRTIAWTTRAIIAILWLK